MKAIQITVDEELLAKLDADDMSRPSRLAMKTKPPYSKPSLRQIEEIYSMRKMS
jgi:hypothetical protein